MNKRTISVMYGVLLCILCIYLLVTLTGGSNAAYYDNTTVESRVNVTNKAPVVRAVSLYMFSNPAQTSIDLAEGTTKSVFCNATVEDWNGWQDIAVVNATIYDANSYNSKSPNDNNYHYFNSSCTASASPINATSRVYSCGFDIWYYADNASWNCNVSAIDLPGNFSNAIAATNTTVNMLAALNLSTLLIDFGNMQPGDVTSTEPFVNVTNTGNVNINLSLNGYGNAAADTLIMNCSLGNITVGYMRYNVTPAQNFNNMANLTNYPLPSGIFGLNITRRVDDGDNQKINSTNATFWKLSVPMGTRGFCNGTVIFSAVV